MYYFFGSLLTTFEGNLGNSKNKVKTKIYRIKLKLSKSLRRMYTLPTTYPLYLGLRHTKDLVGQTILRYLDKKIFRYIVKKICLALHYFRPFRG
jgi:hypothetical protein